MSKLRLNVLYSSMECQNQGEKWFRQLRIPKKDLPEDRIHVKNTLPLNYF